MCPAVLFSASMVMLNFASAIFLIVSPWKVV